MDMDLLAGGHELVPAQLNPALAAGPLDRLDAMLAPTPEWARLREILSSRPAWVQDAVSNALCDELWRSCRNIVEQVRTTRDIMEQMQETLSSDDAIAVGNMLREIHPSSIRGLERAADEVQADIHALRDDLQREDFETMESRARRISLRATRFRNRYAAFRPSLVRLQQKLQELAARCEQQESRSAELIAETESKREWWWRLLTVINWVLVGGGVIMLGGAAGTMFVVKQILMTKASALASGQAALTAAKTAAAGKDSIMSLSAVVSVATPLVVPAALVLALGLLGFAGRELIKSLLGRLWDAEILHHQRTMEWSRQMKQKLREASEKLLTVKEKSDVLTECLDLVVEAADAIGDAAEDAQVMPPEPNMLEQIEKLLSVYENVPPALRDVHQASPFRNNSLHRVELAPRALLLVGAGADGLDLRSGTAVRRLQTASDGLVKVELPSGDHAWVSSDHLQLEDGGGTSLSAAFTFEPSPLSRGDHQALHELEAAARQPAMPGQGDVDGHSLALADSGHSLQSPLSTDMSPTATARHDCLPRSSALLVTVESAATADRLLVEGPSDYVEVQVRPQGCTRKRMVTFCLGGQIHCFTADHPLQVRRSGCAIHVQACMLKVDDVITTTHGPQTLQSKPKIYESVEQVYNLQVFSDAEVFVYPRSGGEAVAVLGSLEDLSSGSSTRSVSSPPGLGQVPSEGSRLCKGGTSCTNVCRKFIRGTCSEGSNCRFCHRPHPEERRRAPRGPRSQSRSSGSA
ncbi:vwkA [Symbiodinium sp. CCMP2592]|nr:vwkA [Symbiodinium sp. CCMP2592]